MKNLIELARVIRSKNAGPYELTLDVIFKTPDIYDKVKTNQLITKENISELYGLKPNQISSIIYFDPAYAVKIVMPRRIVSGSRGDSDVYGAQQHAPLLNLELNVNI